MPKLLELFSGTGSVGKAAQRLGWEVWSLDISQEFFPRICCSIHDWNYLEYPPDFFDAVWASIPCQHYSVLHTKSERDLVSADAITARTIAILQYFKRARWCVENPKDSLLFKRFSFLTRRTTDTSYCRYNGGFHGYRKNTRIASNFPLVLRHSCRGDCDAMEGKRHRTTAQRGPCKGYPSDVDFSVDQLWMIPPELCEMVVNQMALPILLEELPRE